MWLQIQSSERKTYEEIYELYERQQKRNQDFIPMDLEKEAQKSEEEAAEYEKEKEELRGGLLGILSYYCQYYFTTASSRLILLLKTEEIDYVDILVEVSLLVGQTDYAFLNKISEHATEPLSVILQLEPKKLESTVTPIFESLELSANVNFTASTVAFEHNEEMVNAEVDGSDPKMTDDTTAVKSGHAFVHGISVALDDFAELVEVGLRRVPSVLDDVMVALSAYEKGDGLDSFSAAGEEAIVTPPLAGASSASFVHPASFVVSILVQAKLRDELAKGWSALSPSSVTMWPRNFSSFTPNEDMVPFASLIGIILVILGVV
ncbi:hypothetical protein Tco_1111670 [Tanacetum coccineum]|uniref:Uncharacterized protein n=1 Tax=Tanacetum coccineum TaxID=301880 RepID=A0ABQ5IMC8_9ASTR